MKKILPLHVPFYIGLSILLIGIPFRIQHWPYAHHLLWFGLICETIFLIMVLIEIFLSKKASVFMKICWSAFLIAIPVACYTLFEGIPAIVLIVLSILYMRTGRNRFLYRKRDFLKNHFDSI